MSFLDDEIQGVGERIILFFLKFRHIRWKDNLWRRRLRNPNTWNAGFKPDQPKEDDETEAGPEDRLPPRPHRHSLCNLQLGQVAKLSLPSSHDLSPRIILSLYEVTLMALYGNQQSWPVW